MFATAVAKLTQILWKKGWLQLLLEKANNLNKKMDPTIPRIEHSNLEGEKCFVEEKQVLLGSTQFFI